MAFPPQSHLAPTQPVARCAVRWTSAPSNSLGLSTLISPKPTPSCQKNTVLFFFFFKDSFIPSAQFPIPVFYLHQDTQSSLHVVKAELLSPCKPQGCVGTFPKAVAAQAAPAAVEEEVAHGPVPLVTILQDPSANTTPASAGQSKCRHSTRWCWRIKYKSVRKHERHKQ